LSNKLFDQWGGIMKVRLQGARPEKIVNMALARGIFLWDVKKEKDFMTFRIRSSGYEALKSLADENAYDMEVLDRRGLPFMKSAIKRRMAFLGGALGFILALYILSSFVWFISVEGNDRINDKEILDTARRYGVYQGAAKWNFSRNDAEEAILREIKDLSYIKIDIRGVKAHIEVVEKVIPGEEINGPCHLIASQDGVIEEIIVLDGQARVKEGDTVAKGDVLVSGLVIPEINPYMPPEANQNLDPYLVRARGIVKARVWFEGYGECSLYQEKRVLTGSKEHRIYFKTPWNEFKIFGDDKTGFALYQSSEKTNTINTPWGAFELLRIVLQEERVEKKQYTEAEAKKVAEKKALEILQKKLDKSESINNPRIEVLSAPSESVLRVKAAVEIIREITEAKPIKEGENGNKSL
jgi:similar to stage IV sporulation protein